MFRREVDCASERFPHDRLPVNVCFVESLLALSLWCKAFAALECYSAHTHTTFTRLLDIFDSRQADLHELCLSLVKLVITLRIINLRPDQCINDQYCCLCDRAGNPRQVVLAL